MIFFGPEETCKLRFGKNLSKKLIEIWNLLVDIAGISQPKLKADVTTKKNSRNTKI